MNIVFSHGILKKEFRKGQIPPADLTIILEGYADGIFTAIKGESLPKGSRLIKIYATTVKGARRIVFLVDVETGTGFFLFYRSKNDALGKNISIQNPEFRKLLHKYLDILAADISTGKLTTHEMEHS